VRLPRSFLLVDGHRAHAFRTTEDPQALLTRCGSLVLLIELFCFEYRVCPAVDPSPACLSYAKMSLGYQLPLPEIIANASKICLLEDLQQAEQHCLAGWIKALVSPFFLKRERRRPTYCFADCDVIQFGSSGIDDELLQCVQVQTCALISRCLKTFCSAEPQRLPRFSSSLRR
jgi:hypothetical protein